MSNLSDAAGVPGMSADDKIFESSATDEGFFSSDLTHSKSSFSSKADEDDESMRRQVDSGVITDFSNLSIKDPSQNDLNDPKKPSNITSTTLTTTNTDNLYFQQDEDGDTYLHIAIIKGFLEVALALIRSAQHPKFLDTINDDAQTPLHLAVATGQDRIARWLIVAGARPSPRNIRGDSPIHIAARTGDVACCKAILDPVKPQEREALSLEYSVPAYETCNLDQWNYEGQTSVHVAAMSGHMDILRQLVWSGADINAREGRGGYTALHMAIEQGDEEMVSFLVRDCDKLDPTVLTYGKRSVLQLGYPISAALAESLRIRGVDSPYTSEDEYDDSTDEEMPYDNQTMYIPKLVNASA